MGDQLLCLFFSQGVPMESGDTGRSFNEGSNSPEESAYRKLDVVSSCAHSQVFFRTEGVASVKVLFIGWGGQFGCTGVGTAELGLISIAL